MKNKTKLIPKRRFKEFKNDGAWGQQKLGELSDVFDGTHQTPRYTNDGVMFLSVENIKTLQSEKYISEEAFKKEFKIYPKKGDVLMTRIGDIGTANVIESNEPKAYYVSLALLKKKKIDPYFLKESLSSKKVKNDLWRRTLHIAFPKKINKDEITEVLIPVPERGKEQKKIGAFFKNLNNIITFHQNKLEKLKNLKSAYLSDMFPKEGEKYPKLRFPDFTNVWKSYKLTDVAKYRNGKAHENDISEKGKYIVVNSKFVSTEGGVRKYSDKQIEPLYKNEIAFVLSDVPNGRAIARTYLVEKNNKYTLNQRIAGIAPFDNVNPYFLHILMNRNRYFLEFDDGAKQTNLSVADVMAFESFYLKFEEQQKIGQFFKNLDSLIEFQQQKLEKLENVKKAYLNEMFV